MKGQEHLPYTADEIMKFIVMLVNATEKKDVTSIDLIADKLQAIADRYEYLSKNFDYGGSNRIKSTVEK